MKTDLDVLDVVLDHFEVRLKRGEVPSPVEYMQLLRAIDAERPGFLPHAEIFRARAEMYDMLDEYGVLKDSSTSLYEMTGQALAGTLRRKIPWSAALTALVLIGITIAIYSHNANQKRQLNPDVADTDKIPPGYKRVHLTTKPEGARVVFWGLLPNGDPDPSKRFDAGLSPVQVDLEPGDYLVVAALGKQRFHEVYRRVPDGPGNPFRYRHLRSEQFDQTVLLPTVQVVSPNLQGLAQAGPINIGTNLVIASDFYAPGAQRVLGISPQSTVDDVHYDEAHVYAESIGARLPTRSELALARIAGVLRPLSEGFHEWTSTTTQTGEIQFAVAGDPDNSELFVDRRTKRKKLGFRLVRSRRPRLNKEDL